MAGCWKTNTCDHAYYTDENGQDVSLGYWGERMISYHNDGSIKSVVLKYADDGCAANPEIGAIAPFNDHDTYEDHGVLETFSEGVSVGTLSFTGALGDVTSGYYMTFPDGRLCFSDNILVGGLYSNYGFFDTENFSFDLVNCLNRVG